MANEEHLAILRQGVEVWNKWRHSGVALSPDLSHGVLRELDLGDAYLLLADLNWADLTGANLTGANLTYANLGGAVLNAAALQRARLGAANLGQQNYAALILLRPTSGVQAGRREAP